MNHPKFRTEFRSLWKIVKCDEEGFLLNANGWEPDRMGELAAGAE